MNDMKEIENGVKRGRVDYAEFHGYVDEVMSGYRDCLTEALENIAERNACDDGKVHFSVLSDKAAGVKYGGYTFTEMWIDGDNGLMVNYVNRRGDTLSSTVRSLGFEVLTRLYEVVDYSLMFGGIK